MNDKSADRNLHFAVSNEKRTLLIANSGLMADFRVVRFVVYDEPIWRFSAYTARSADAQDIAWISQIHDFHVGRCAEGLEILLAVAPSDTASAEKTGCEREWCRQAVAALRAYFRQESPQAQLRLYRDPIDSSLRNLAD